MGACADWLLGSFFLGYFFSAIQGSTGLRKGLRLSLAIVACLLPVWLVGALTPNDFRVLVLRVAQNVLFYTVLGVWAFDHRIFRQLPIASAGVVLHSILSEPTTSLLPLLAKLFFSPAGPGPTPLP
jgi:hypothetical protein